MRKRTVLQECLLSAAIVAAPATCLAVDTPALKPVEASLRQVPTSDAGGVTLAVTSEQQTTSTEPVISLVQHQSSSGFGEETQSKKPGLFKRFLKRFTVTDDSPREGNMSGNMQPGVPIPTPPPIDFTIRDKHQSQPESKTVNAQPTGFGAGNAPTYRPSDSHVAQPLVPYVQQQQKQSVNVYTPPASDAAVRNDTFIDPFVADTDIPSGDALLDLDSLIHGKVSASQGAKNSLQADSKSTEGLVPEIDFSASKDPMRVIPSRRPTSSEAPKSQKAPSADPFSGYRLPSDDEVLGLPDPGPEPIVESAPKVEQVPVIEPEPSPEPVKVDEPVAASPTVVRIPLLEEPAMALPPVADEWPQESPYTEIAPVEAAAAQPVLIEAAPSEESPEILQPRFVDEPAASTQTLKVMDGRARREQQRYRIMSRVGKLGFKGFCPVTLRDQRDLVDSRERFAAKFGLQTYYFSSQEAKSAFEANPARYAPAGGGSDVVLLVNTGEEAPGSLDFSLWYRDRLYMFRSRETQAMFSKDPRQYADQY